MKAMDTMSQQLNFINRFDIVEQENVIVMVEKDENGTIKDVLYCPVKTFNKFYDTVPSVDEFDNMDALAKEIYEEYQYEKLKEFAKNNFKSFLA